MSVADESMAPDPCATSKIGTRVSSNSGCRPLSAHSGAVGSRCGLSGERSRPAVAGGSPQRAALDRTLPTPNRLRNAAPSTRPRASPALGPSPGGPLAGGLEPAAHRFRLCRHELDGAVTAAMVGRQRGRAPFVGGHPPTSVAGARLCVEAFPLRAEPRPAAREKNAGSAAKSGPWPRARCSWPWTKPTCCCCRPCGRVGR